MYKRQDKDGFFCQTAPGNGRYYRYSEIRNMWLSSGRETNARQPTYCNFETVEGKRMRFLVLGSQIDAVDYMIERVESMGNKSGEDDLDWEIVITGKKEAGFVVIPTILSLIMLAVMVMLFLAWNLPPIVIAVPVILELMSLSQILSLGLFYKVIIQKDGFYCRTNPFDGRYYRYSDILDWRLVESQRKIGSRYNRGRIRKMYYFYDLKFIDRAHQTHRLPYNLSLIHISEPTRLGMISYAVFCLKKKKNPNTHPPPPPHQKDFNQVGLILEGNNKVGTGINIRIFK